MLRRSRRWQKNKPARIKKLTRVALQPIKSVMTPELCAHYSSLAIDPEQNKDELEGIVRECAVQAGFLEQKMFRGHAREAGAAEEPFRKGAAPSFTDIPDIALVYAHRPETVCGFSIGRAKKTPHTQVREAYIKIERPLTMKNLMTPFGEVLDKLNIVL